MAVIYVVFFTKRGRLLTLSKEIARGAESVPGTTVKLFRVPDHGSDHLARFEEEVLKVPVITPDMVKSCDGIVLGCPGRQGHMCSQVARFLDGLAPEQHTGALAGKVAGAFTSTGGVGRGHGGHEHILQNFHSTFLQYGMIVAGVPPSPLMDNVELASPYGVCMGGEAGSGARELEEAEAALAYEQGRHVASIANTVAKLKIYVIFFTRRGRLYTLAQKIAEGARRIAGADVKIFRVMDVEEGGVERFEEGVLKVPLITPDRLKECDGFIIGTPGRQGHACAQVTNFLDGLAKEQHNGSLVGKVAGAFTSTGGVGRGHGGHEHILQNFHSTFLQYGMIVAGVPPCSAMDSAELASPYGVCMGGGAGSGGRDLSTSEEELALAQGEHVARYAKMLKK